MNAEGIIEVVENDRYEALPDGRLFQDIEIVLDPNANDRVRLGYQCGRCLEVFVHAWPDHCRLCGFDVGATQRRYYEKHFVGSRVLRTSLTQEELADGEERLYQMLKERSG